jgi:hypothetical protein
MCSFYEQGVFLPAMWVMHSTFLAGSLIPWYMRVSLTTCVRPFRLLLAFPMRASAPTSYSAFPLGGRNCGARRVGGEEEMPSPEGHNPYTHPLALAMKEASWHL